MVSMGLNIFVCYVDFHLASELDWVRRIFFSCLHLLTVPEDNSLIPSFFHNTNPPQMFHHNYHTTNNTPSTKIHVTTPQHQRTTPAPMVRPQRHRESNTHRRNGAPPPQGDRTDGGCRCEHQRRRRSTVSGETECGNGGRVQGSSLDPRRVRTDVVRAFGGRDFHDEEANDAW